MRKRISIALAAVAAAVVVPAVVVAASTAYTSPTLKVSQAGTKTVIAASAAVADDATARVAIYVGTPTITASQAPGTAIGSVKAQVSALALGGALLPLTGPIIVAPPGAIPAATQAACTQGVTPTATWLLQLTAAGQTLNVPAYLLPTTGPEFALGPAKLAFCLPPPDIPVEQGGATFGAKFLSAELTVDGVFGPVPTAAWIAFWTPWQAGNGQVNAAGTVASPAAIAPGAVTAKAKKKGLGAVVSGAVTQSGQPRSNATVAIWGAKGKAALRRLGAVKAKANGTYTFTPKTGDVFQARVVAASGSAPPLCAALTPALGGIPCVNPTVNGFTVQSKQVRKK